MVAVVVLVLDGLLANVTRVKVHLSRQLVVELLEQEALGVKVAPVETA